MNVAITGARGFIGSHLCEMINDLGHKVICISRKKNENCYSFEDLFQLKINSNIDCFIHLASPNYDYAKDSSLEDGISLLTEKILKVLDNYNCKKLIFFSSAKIYGEPSITRNYIFKENSVPSPLSDYGKEKLKAEKKIISHSQSSNLNYVIYRMPMVYDSGNKSNVNRLLKLIEKSYPFILFKNINHLKKSFLSIENIKLCIEYNLQNIDSISSDIFNISDKNNVSVNEFIINIKKILDSRSILITLPYFLLKFLIKLPFLGRYFLKLYGQHEISNQNVQKTYKIEFFDTYSCISRINNE